MSSASSSLDISASDRDVFASAPSSAFPSSAFFPPASAPSSAAAAAAAAAALHPEAPPRGDSCLTARLGEPPFISWLSGRRPLLSRSATLTPIATSCFSSSGVTRPRSPPGPARKPSAAAPPNAPAPPAAAPGKNPPWSRCNSRARSSWSC